jgi:hypothetical protein
MAESQWRQGPGRSGVPRTRGSPLYSTYTADADLPQCYNAWHARPTCNHQSHMSARALLTLNDELGQSATDTQKVMRGVPQPPTPPIMLPNAPPVPSLPQHLPAPPFRRSAADAITLSSSFASVPVRITASMLACHWTFAGDRSSILRQEAREFLSEDWKPFWEVEERRGRKGGEGGQGRRKKGLGRWDALGESVRGTSEVASGG